VQLEELLASDPLYAVARKIPDARKIPVETSGTKSGCTLTLYVDWISLGRLPAQATSLELSVGFV